MTSTNLLQLGLGLGLLFAIAVLFAGIRRRRHREHLLRLCHKFSLGVLESDVRPQAVALASLVDGEVCKVRLRDVLVGFDDDGKFYLSERRVGRHRHQILFFERQGGPQLRGFRFAPQATSRAERGSGDAPPGYAVRWNAALSHWTDESVLSLGARVLYHSARTLEATKEAGLVLEVDGHRILIHSLRPLAGSDLAQFFADATKLRRLLLGSQRKAEAVGSGARAVASTAAPMVVA